MSPRHTVIRQVSVLLIASCAICAGDLRAGVLSLVSDINSGAASSSPQGLTVVDDSLFFSAEYSDGSRYLYQSDGTSSVRWNVSVGGAPVTNPQYITGHNGRVFYQGTNSIYGTEPFYLDPSVPTGAFWDGASTDFAPQEFVEFDGKLYTSADWGSGKGEVGRELTVIDGNTISVAANVRQGKKSSNPGEFAVFENELYFTAEGKNVGRELYKFDGTTATQVADINSKGDSNPTNLTVVNNKLVFAADGGTNGVELYEYDGTTVSLVADLNSGTASSSPTSLTKYRGSVYFQATTAASGSELYKYDGSTVTQVADIVSGSGSSNPDNLTVQNDELYFSATSAAGGNELHVYDIGTNTVSRASDVNPGAGGSNPSDLADFNGGLYFAADDGANGRELYKYQSDNLSVYGETYTASADRDYAGYVRVGGIEGSNLNLTGDGTEISAADYALVQNGGVLDIGQGATLSSPNGLTIDEGGVLSGTGTVNADVDVAGTLAPGNSPGVLFLSGNVTVGSSGLYDFEVNDFGGTTDGDPGWDFVGIFGDLTITPGATLRVNSLTLGNVAGDAANFDPTQSYSLLVLGTTGTISGQFTLDTSYFTNSLQSGSFALVTLNSNRLYLTFTANSGANGSTPEPSSVVFLGMGLGGGWYVRRRRKAAGDDESSDDEETEETAASTETCITDTVCR